MKGTIQLLKPNDEVYLATEFVNFKQLKAVYYGWLEMHGDRLRKGDLILIVIQNV